MSWFSEAFSESGVFSLLAQHLWQVSLLAAIAWVLAMWLGDRRPYLTYGLWLLVLLKCLIPPLVAVPYAPFCWLQTTTQRSNAVASVDDVSAAASPPVSASPAKDGSTSKPPAPAPLPQPAASKSAPSTDWHSSFAASSSSSARVAPAPATANQNNSPGCNWQALVVALWLGGSCLALVIAAGRLLRFMRRARSSRVEPQGETVEVFERLREELGRRSMRRWRRAQLYVVDEMLGPAVVGLWRPVVLLPRVLERDCTPHELRILLAHEWMHVRRGDLYGAIVHALAVCLWWFHPLVRWAGRRFEQATERCCDQQTVASLGCTPAEYARVLLGVLERKYPLRVAPALPGVRPMHLTKQRMEQIMRMKPERVSRPWWSRLVLWSVGLAVLPGGAWLAAQEQRSTVGRLLEKQRKNTQTPVGDVADAFSSPTLEDAEPPALLVRQYDVRDQIAKLVAEQDVDHSKARSMLTVGLRQLNRTEVEPESVIFQGDDQLVVKASESFHQWLTDELDRIAEFGYQHQIAITTRFVSLPVARLEGIVLDWDAKTRTDSGLPVLTATLSTEATARLLNEFQQDARTNVLMAPKVTVFNGQQFRLTDTTQRPFVVGVREASKSRQQAYTPSVDRPSLALMEEGIRMEVRPTNRGDHITWDVVFERKMLQDVGNLTFQRLGEAVTLQVPRSTRDAFTTSLQASHTATLAFALPSQDSTESLLMILLTPERIQTGEPPRPAPIADANPPAATQTEAHAIVPPAILLPSDYYQPMESPASADVPHKNNAGVTMLLKADGPPMDEAATKEIREFLAAFVDTTHVTGNFKHELHDSKLELSGTNVAIALDAVSDWRLFTARGVVTFAPAKEHPDQLSLHVRAHAEQVIEMDLMEGMRAVGTEMTYDEVNLEWSGNPARLFYAPDNAAGEAQRIRYGEGLELQGSATLTIGETTLRADRITTIDEGDQGWLRLQGNVRVQRQREGDDEPLELEASEMYFDLETHALRL
ncbi:M56 family metallopeptidase [Roseimaritima sediminicola]|uniref:M56 family metallopeptidase n=1 Tax=Roseimaritima sediminicola TaxID=2662066 RepID=UPI00138705B6|nr:M56 family metallopeptidase [Roseimaritima sediminicola]